MLIVVNFEFCDVLSWNWTIFNCFILCYIWRI